MPGSESPKDCPESQGPGVAESRGPKGTRTRPLDGEGRPYITLAQFVKMKQFVQSGGEAKHFVREGGITVNGEPEARPGRKLHTGDKVTVKGAEMVVAVAG